MDLDNKQNELGEVSEAENENDYSQAQYEEDLKKYEEIKERKPEKETQKKESKGMSMWTGGAILIGCIAVFLMIFVNSGGEFFENAEEWSERITGYRGSTWIELESRYQAEKSVNYSIYFPDEIGGLTDQDYWIIKNYNFAVHFLDENGYSRIIVYKCTDDDLESADTNEYEETIVKTIDGIEVTEKGSDGLVQSITWAGDGYWYQVITADDYMLEREYAESLVSQIS